MRKQRYQWAVESLEFFKPFIDFGVVDSMPVNVVDGGLRKDMARPGKQGIGKVAQEASSTMFWGSC